MNEDQCSIRHKGVPWSAADFCISCVQFYCALLATEGLVFKGTSGVIVDLPAAKAQVAQLGSVLLADLLHMAVAYYIMAQLCKRLKVPIQEAFKCTPHSQSLLTGFSTGAVAIFGVGAWQLVVTASSATDPLNSVSLPADSYALSIGFLALSNVVCGPLLEEYFYRGYVQQTLSSWTNVHLSILISSFVFAISHFDFSQLPQLTILGIVLGYCYQFSGRNLATSVFAHTTYNSVILSSLLLV